MKEYPWMLGLAPLMLAVPFVTLGNYCREAAFGRYWMSRLQSAQLPVEMETAA